MSATPSGSSETQEARPNKKQACDVCRKKKIKCEWSLDADDPVCAQCRYHRTPCTTNHVIKERTINPRKRRHSSNSNPTQIEEMISLLRRIVDVIPSQEGPADKPRPPAKLPDIQSLNALMGSEASTESWETAYNELGSLLKKAGKLTNDNSASSLLTQEPSLTNKAFNKTIVDNHMSFIFPESATVGDARFGHWKQEIFDDIFLPSPHTIIPLPETNEALSLIEDFFVCCNNPVLPLFDQGCFMKLVQNHDSRDGNRHEGSGWWASLNIVIALAYRLRAMRKQYPHEENKRAWAYLRNAIAVLPELTLRNKDLLSIRALLGIAIFLQGTSSPYSCYSVLAAAIRQLHCLGLHRRVDGLSSEEVKQRTCVFWIAYLLDKDISLRTSQPFMQSDFDMDVDLPTSLPDNVGKIWLKDGTKFISIFLLRVQLAMIQSKIYQNLYSIQARKLSDKDKVRFIAELASDLDAWKGLMPCEFLPENFPSTVETTSAVHLNILYSSYFNCLIMVHSQSPGYDLDPLAPATMEDSQLCGPADEACTSAARSTLKIIRRFPQGDYACIWLNLHFLLLAFVVLAGSIVQNPVGNDVSDDLELIESTYRLVKVLCDDPQNTGIVHMLEFCGTQLGNAWEAAKEPYSRLLNNGAENMI